MEMACDLGRVSRRAALVAAMAAWTGCSSSTPPAADPMGGERQSCYPNHTCNAGLVCLSNVCVSPPDGGGSGGSGAAGATGSGGSSGAGGTTGGGGVGASGGAGATGAGGTGQAGATGTGGTGAAGAGAAGASGAAGSGAAGGSQGTAGGSGSGGSTLTCLQGASNLPVASLITDFSDATPDPSHAGQFVYGASGGVTGGTATYASGTLGALTLSGGALTYTATVEAPSSSDLYPYSGFTVFIAGPACVNATGYTGVAFTMSVTGSCKNVFMFSDATHLTPTNDPARGSCSASAAQCYASQFLVSSTTTSVAFGATPTVVGMPTQAVDTGRLTGVQWQFSLPDGATTGCSGSFTVDNIRFF